MIILRFAQLINADKIPHLSTNPADKAGNNITEIFNVVFALLGAVAFLMIVIAGLRYIRAGSDASKVSDAKRQIAHAAVGLIVAASASILVHFVLSRAG